MSPLLALSVVIVLMAAELFLSRHNERRLRASAAIEPAGDVYPWLRIIYPASFIAMALEGLLREQTGLAGHATGDTAALVLAGGSIFVASKALKAWAIASLGGNWSFRVLVRPGRPLVTSGPYRYLRHPNYLAIGGELIGMAVTVFAPLTGIAALVAAGILLRKRIRIEERALGLRI